MTLIDESEIERSKGAEGGGGGNEGGGGGGNRSAEVWRG